MGYSLNLAAGKSEATESKRPPPEPWPCRAALKSPGQITNARRDKLERTHWNKVRRSMLAD